VGDKGIIRAADQHHCSECTQKYNAQTDQVSFYDPAATVGIDENELAPRLEVEVGDTQVYPNTQQTQSSNTVQASADGNADVRMVVLDGIVVGPTVGFSEYFIILKSNYINSIVPIIIVKRICLIPEEVFSVRHISMSLVQGVMYKFKGC
jgi:hypothetical protein